MATSSGGETEWLLGPSGEVLVRGVVDPRGQAFKLFPGAVGGVPILTSAAVQGDFRTDLEGLGRSPDKLLLWERSDDDVLLKEVSMTSGGAGEILSRGTTPRGVSTTATRAS